jgi:hypothetical protein
MLTDSINLSETASASLVDDPRWQLAQRIVASRCFHKSTFLINFLLYVCDRQLSGRTDEISEHQIGIQALGRPASYNPGEDNIVRNYARLLRKRLEEYFETEGSHETLRLQIPRGRYLPVFYDSAAPSAASPPNVAPIAPPNTGPIIPDASLVSGTARSRQRILIGFLLAVLVVAALTGTIVMHSAHPSVSLANRFWGTVFGNARPTLIVPADSGLGILQNLDRHPIHLSDYVSGAYLSHPEPVPGLDRRNLNDLTTQRYTSVVDLGITASLMRLPELNTDRASIRYARDLRMEDLKHSNAILLGSSHTNPWVELFQQSMNFTLEYKAEVDESVVINRHPLATEQSWYKNEWAEESRRTYAVLAMVPSLDGDGVTILVEGLNMAGTQAAGDFLLSDTAMNPILKKASRPDGSLQPFELLLETNNIGANAPQARVIAARFGSAPAVQP